MLDTQTAFLIVGAIGLLLNLLATAVGVTWKLSKVEAGVREAISESENDVKNLVNTQAREFGETVAAIRQGVQISEQRLQQQIHQMEVFNRDTFVRRESFLAVRDELKREVHAGFDKINERLERMEEKIDSKT